MNKEEFKQLLLSEKKKYISKSFEELISMKEPVTYEIEIRGQKCQVEVFILERNAQYVQVSVNIDDFKFPKVIMPLSESFVKYADGRVDILNKNDS